MIACATLRNQADLILASVGDSRLGEITKEAFSAGYWESDMTSSRQVANAVFLILAISCDTTCALAAVIAAGDTLMGAYPAATYVGHNTTGTFTIDEGSVWNNGPSYIGYNATAIGTAAIGGAGSTWKSYDHLYVGYLGQGSLSVHSSGTVISRYGYIGNSAGATGTVTINGSGSKWTNSYDFRVGNVGNGTLRIEAGGQVTSTQRSYIGYDIGSFGSTTVTGPGSTWTNSAELYVGFSGFGSLTVSDSGFVTAKALYASLSDLYGNGTIAVNGGAVLDTTLSFDQNNGMTQTLNFGSGGTLNLTVDGTGDLGIGYRGRGSLRIADGMSISSRYGYVGLQSGANGTAAVTGNGSQWTTSTGLHIGYQGAGSLAIEAGGQVSSPSGTIGLDAGSSGSASVSGNNSKWAMTTSGLEVGVSGSGAINIQNGAQVTSNGGKIGASAGSNGTVTIHGTGSSWTCSNGIAVGNYGTGTLNIGSGGQLVSTATAYVGCLAGSKASVTVDGVGSKWSHSAGLFVASYSAAARLTILNGGEVSSNHGVIASSYGSNGTVVVNGSGSKWAIGTDLYVSGSNNAFGKLDILSGGQVTCMTGYIASNAGSVSETGTVLVSGPGSSFKCGTYLWVGDLTARAGLTIADGATVTARNLIVGTSGSRLTVDVTGNNMVVLGDSATTGTLTNYGKLKLFCGPLISEGIYTPFAEFAGRPLTWLGSGSFKAWGGLWDNSTLTFTVAPATRLSPGISNTIVSGERLLLTDPPSGRRMGISFGALVPYESD